MSIVGANGLPVGQQASQVQVSLHADAVGLTMAVHSNGVVAQFRIGLQEVDSLCAQMRAKVQEVKDQMRAAERLMRQGPVHA